ncbi:cellulase-like family protein [Parabacteroides chongii]|uniref:cellulase-like family protein n=1 Tax=Parabacteroides chongii TaxID=2685834 RepID=UPI00240DD0A7|nr:cellulase-like family protein [Parabacteroides chongii]WFE82802.1 cellulase-like family protein [Parabacteroides chongii]
MDRRNFIKKTSLLTISGLSTYKEAHSSNNNEPNKVDIKGISPRAITMWDFSWLERRWPGAGYENWDKILDELEERGYNAIRIDAFPHLIAENPTKKWILKEVWNQQVWGSPDLNEVQIQPSLNIFLMKCQSRNIKVGLSSWFREDIDNTRMKITSPDKLADCWIKTLQSIECNGLLDTILYVDLCNEWPGYLWAPFFTSQYSSIKWGQWYKEESLLWIKNALEKIKNKYPQIPFTFSFDNKDIDKYEEIDTDFLDLYEHHIWMVQQNNNEFYKLVGYKNGQFSPDAYKKVVSNAEKLYRDKPSYWQKLLTDNIQLIAKTAKKNKRPLITTECWGIVDYKDWPLLSWDWVKELCTLGTVTAAQTGMWAGIATSNFCGPQFTGMWRDINWHQNLTKLIKSSSLDECIINKNDVADKLLKRL